MINFLINFWKNLNDIIRKSLKKILLDGQLSQTIFKGNKESIDINYNEKSTRTSIINYLNKEKSYLWCGGELNLYLQFDYLYDCLKLLRLYLISYSNELFLLKNNIEVFNEKQNNNTNKKIFSDLKITIRNIFVEILNSIDFKYFNKKFSYYILSFLYEIKELFPHFISEEMIQEKKTIKRKSFSYSNINEQYNKSISSDDQSIINNNGNSGIFIIYKTIFISLFLSWNYEDKICTSFDKYLKTNFKSKLLLKDKFIILEKFFYQKKIFDEGLQKLIEHLSDILCLYLM